MTKEFNIIKAQNGPNTFVEDDKKRLQAVRDVFWEFTPEYEGNSKSLNLIKNQIRNRFSVNITNAQEKIIFDNLPQEIIGEIVKYGFFDIDVKESIYDFFDEQEKLLNAVLVINGLKNK